MWAPAPWWLASSASTDNPEPKTPPTYQATGPDVGGIFMKRNLILFTAGGGVYVALELLWRRRSHWSMFLLGGACFLAIGVPGRHLKGRHLALRSLLGSVTITAGELLTGLLLNRDHRIWDYRDLPLNYRGQICLPFSVLWIGAAGAASLLFEALDRRLER